MGAAGQLISFTLPHVQPIPLESPAKATRPSWAASAIAAERLTGAAVPAQAGSSQAGSSLVRLGSLLR
jgi:hypothetical protein